MINWLDFLGLFLMLTGFVIGLGAVNVIDFHAWLGRRSKYWTEAATRTHKITKPLIWIGILHIIAGGCIFYRNVGMIPIVQAQIVLGFLISVNGAYLTYKISPLLLKHELEGDPGRILPLSVQRVIRASFAFSFVAWWSELGLLTYYLIQK